MAKRALQVPKAKSYTHMSDRKRHSGDGTRHEQTRSCVFSRSAFVGLFVLKLAKGLG